MEFNFQTFTNLMTISPERAMKYRDECHQAMKKEVKEETQEVIEPIITPKNNIDTIEYNPDDFTEDEEETQEEKTEFTREDLISKLKNANIKYMPNSKDETLLKKCIENNLI